MFALAIGDGTLTDPADKILVHDMAGDPASGLFIDDGRIPVRDAVLQVRLALLRHAGEEPADAERIGVVDRHTPFEVIAGEQHVGPQADPTNGPKLAALVGILAHAV